MSQSDWPMPFGADALTATFKNQAEDFIVHEDLGFEPDGQGEHMLVHVEKREANTQHIAKALAAWAGIRPMDVGYAGLKDRHAVTRQWFSLRLPKKQPPNSTFEHPEASILAHTWHGRKLPKGAHQGNFFTLLLRDVVGDEIAIEQRLTDIKTHGVPNYFGQQRFGRSGDNVAQALTMFSGKKVPKNQRSILLSAARSQLFNQVLAARVRDGTWNRACDGDVFNLDGRNSVFGPEPLSDELHQRVASFDIHPTGMMWGKGELRTTDAVAELETSIAKQHPKLCEGLQAAGLKQARRSLRLAPQTLTWHQHADNQTLELSFWLPPSAYATVVLQALGDVREGR